MNLPPWIEEARRRRLALPAGVAALVAVLMIIGGWSWWAIERSRGERALAEASLLVQQAMAPQAPADVRARAIKALETLLSEHPRFSGAAQAAYLLGNLQYAVGQYAAARGAYQVALAKGASGTLKMLSAVGIGYTWEAEKSYGNASGAYEAALASMGVKDFVYEDTLVALGRAQDLDGKPAAAVETYQRVLRDLPDSRRSDDLKTRLAELKARSRP
jgi:tetratricopeptide (TPR) repeat protein